MTGLFLRHRYCTWAPVWCVHISKRLFPRRNSSRARWPGGAVSMSINSPISEESEVELLAAASRPQTEEAAAKSSTSDSSDIGELIDIETAPPGQRALLELRRGNRRLLICTHQTGAQVQYLCRRNSPVIVEPGFVGIVQRLRGR